MFKFMLELIVYVMVGKIALSIFESLPINIWLARLLAGLVVLFLGILMESVKQRPKRIKKICQL
ncbi:hypothetical protein HZY93_05595 [Streptococcus danieliae]|uniref:Uncharacterized protein n=1 Tax=Streptococcus danieliae TaxID=747656 RepID=A0A7Z0LDM8_9STRE|nr:hypothetical protein [Streptococcus danieliae]MBF0717510.1 hypothetical protein [Streptococcus danieliae]NYS49440.1 hypothetical protein [Streptococcus danieliae]